MRRIVAAAGPRWHQFPWNDVVATSVAFGLGLSMASEVPEVEVDLEGASEQLLILCEWRNRATPKVSLCACVVAARARDLA